MTPRIRFATRLRDFRDVEARLIARGLVTQSSPATDVALAGDDATPVCDNQAAAAVPAPTSHPRPPRRAPIGRVGLSLGCRDLTVTDLT